jgi:anti-sigma factor RsiW
LKCHEVSELVTAYLEGALPVGTRFATRLHLRLCVHCRRYVAQFQETIRLLAGGPPPPPPENENEIIALITAGKAD